MARRALIALLAALALLAPAAASAAPAPRTTLPDVEDEVMCVLCGTALNVADSSQADRERAFIEAEIAKGKTKAQVKQALVGEYGPQVLGTPEGGGFDWAAWVVPSAVVLALLGGLIFLVPRWRRRSSTTDTDAATPAVASPALSAADARRLEEDLARYDR